MFTTTHAARLIATLLTCAATTAMAQNSNSSGSAAIPSECRVVEQRADGLLVAECSTRDGDRASAIRASECRSSIVTRNGVLACTGTTAIVGPIRTTTQQTVIGGLLASVLGTPQPAAPAMDMEWIRDSQPLGQRRAEVDARIDAGDRDGSLSRREVSTLRRDHAALIRLEQQYAQDGQFSTEERVDLNNRYAALSARIGSEPGDNQGNASAQLWQPLVERRADFDRRVENAQSARVISSTEANRLRTDWQGLMQLENQYRANGIDNRETGDLAARLEGLERRLGRFGNSSDNTAGNSNTQPGNWAVLESRINTADRDRKLNRNQVERLLAEHGDLSRLDAAWRRYGLGSTEQAYLARRYKELSDRIDMMERQR